MTYPNPLETPEIKKEIAQLKENAYTFEEFLKEMCPVTVYGFDDDTPDAYDEWLTNLQADEWIKLGEAYAKSKQV